MGVRRHRFKQTTTLDKRLWQFGVDLQSKAKTLDPNSEEARDLQKRLQQTEAARRFNTSLNNGR